MVIDFSIDDDGSYDLNKRSNEYVRHYWHIKKRKVNLTVSKLNIMWICVSEVKASSSKWKYDRSQAAARVLRILCKFCKPMKWYDTFSGLNEKCIYYYSANLAD